MEKALQQSLAAADAAEAAAATAAAPCEASVVEVEVCVRPAAQADGAKQHAAAQAKLGQPPVMVRALVVS